MEEPRLVHIARDNKHKKRRDEETPRKKMTTSRKHRHIPITEEKKN